MPNGTVVVRVFGADGKPFDTAKKQILYTIIDGNNQQRFRDYRKSSAVAFPLELHNDLSDFFRIIVWADGFLQAGCESLHVVAGAAVLKEVQFMLVPKEAKFDFSRSSWDRLKLDRPNLFTVLSSMDGDTADPRQSYEDLMKKSPDAVATLLNVTTAMDQIKLGDDSGRSALQRFIAMNWNCTNKWVNEQKPDRFFAYADLTLLDGINRANQVEANTFAWENPVLHWCKDTSFKETKFQEANVQFSFATTSPPPCSNIPANCHIVDCDMDYYKDIESHLLLEVLPNKFFGGRTNPRRTFVLRWMEAKRMQIEHPELQVPDYDPPYLMVP